MTNHAFHPIVIHFLLLCHFVGTRRNFVGSPGRLVLFLLDTVTGCVGRRFMTALGWIDGWLPGWLD